MSFKRINRLPSTDEIRERFPLSEEQKKIKAKNDEQLSKVFRGEDNRLVVIMGPCSAHDVDAVIKYTDLLANLQEKVRDKIIFVPRVYTNKPRTVGSGYKGMLHQPDPNKQPDIVEGIHAIRQLHRKVLSESGLPVADEMLYPENHEYVSDILSYVAVGARSVENQLHRLTASGLDIPVGMKNPTSGDISVMLNSIQAAQADHIFGYNGYEVSTEGNPLAHAIMRGAHTMSGGDIPNYHHEDLAALYELYKSRGLPNAGVIVDTNHSNSGKKYAEQPRIFQEIIDTRKHSTELSSFIKGVMIESFLVEGTQKIEDGVFGKSITDPCIGWDVTEKMILSIAEQL